MIPVDSNSLERFPEVIEVTINEVRVEISRTLNMPMQDILICRVNKSGYSYLLTLRRRGNWETVAHERTANLCWVVYQVQNRRAKSVQDIEKMNRSFSNNDSRRCIDPSIKSNTLSSYPTPWEGDLILACRKCQKKLKGNRTLRALAKLRKSIERLNRQHQETPFHIVNVACMGRCPEKGVTICNTAWRTDRLIILYGEEDIERVYGSRSNQSVP
jgi:hypothetical protein